MKVQVAVLIAAVLVLGVSGKVVNQLVTTSGSVLASYQLPAPTFISEDATCTNANSGNSVTVVTDAKSVQEGVCSYSGTALLAGGSVEYDSEWSGEHAHESFCKGCYGGFVVGNAKSFVVLEYAGDRINTYGGKVKQRHITKNRGSPRSSFTAPGKPTHWTINIDVSGSAVATVKFADGTEGKSAPFQIPSAHGFIGFWSVQGVTQTVTNIKVVQGKNELPPPIVQLRIPPERLSASCSWDANHDPRWSYLNNDRVVPCPWWCAQAWCACRNDNNQWIQADIETITRVTGVLIQGRGDHDQWVNAVRIGYSNDGNNWTWLPNSFNVNAGRNNVITIPVDFRARYVRINPVGYTNHISMRFALLAESDQLALNTGSMSSSTVWVNNYQVCGPANAIVHRLNPYGASSWCSWNLDNQQWLQTDFGRLKKLSQFQIQGRADADQWITSFQLSHSRDGATWTTLPTTYTGNRDRYSVVTVPIDVTARFVRLLPQTWYNHISCRIGFRGVDMVDE